MKLLSIAILVLLVACNKKEEKETLTAPSAADYGVYTRCDSEDGISIKTIVSFHQASLVGSFTVYAGAKCNPGYILFNEKDIFSYTKSGTDYVLSAEAVAMTALSTAASDGFNTKHFCGYSNWFSDIPKNVLGQNCEGTTVSLGETQNVSIFKSGSSLVMKEGNQKTSYSKVHTINFANRGLALTNGSYAYYDGSRAVFLTLASPNFSMRLYDETTHRFYIKSGTYTSANNVGSFSAVSNTPTCGTDVGVIVDRKFFQSGTTLALEGLEGTDWLFEKTTLSDTQFEDAFLTGTYVQQCF